MAARLGHRQLQYAVIIRTPIPPSTTGDVTGAATASATITATRSDTGAVAAAVTAAATITAARSDTANLTGAVTASASIDATTATVGNVTGAATASATISATSVDPLVQARPIVVSDTAGPYLARLRMDPVTLVFTQYATGSADVSGAVTAAATITADAVTPIPAQPVMVVDSERALLLRQAPLDRVTLVTPVRQPATAGDLNGAVTASATVAATRSDTGAVSGAVTASASIAGSTASVGNVTGAATASATVTATRSDAANLTGAVTAAATVRAVASGLVVGVVTASASITASESGGQFEPIGVLSASSSSAAVFTSSTRKAGGPS